MTAFLILAVAALGCGSVLPPPGRRPESAIGLRFLAGISVMALVLYVGNPVLGIRLGLVTTGIMGLAALGLVRLALEVWRGLYSRRALVHPVPVFVFLVVALIAVRGGVDYLPWQWDEYSRWVYMPKLIFLTQQYYLSEIELNDMGYTPAWILLTAFPSLVAGHHAENSAALLPFLMHAGLLGMIFELTQRCLQHNTPLTPRLCGGLAWLVVLSLLAVEASWKLVPTLLATEKPQIYFLAAGFLVTMYMAVERAHRQAYCAYLGLFLAGLYLIKVAGLAVVPSTLLLAGAIVVFNFGANFAAHRNTGAMTWRQRLADDFPDRMLSLCWMYLPLALCVATWSAIATSKSCYGAPTAMLAPESVGVLFTGVARQAAGIYIDGIFGYLSAFKLPLTLIGGAGILVALAFRRTSLAAIMLLSYIVVYVLALYYYHVVCFLDFIERGELNSIPRFTRIWLRLLHTIGPVLAVLAIIEWAGRRKPALLGAAGTARAAAVAVPILALALFGWQVAEANRSLHQMATRSDTIAGDGGTRLKMVRAVRRQAVALKRLIRRRNLAEPRVLMIVQGSDGMEIGIAKYAAIADQRDGSLFHYRISNRFSFGERPTDASTQRTSAGNLVEILREFRIVWPFALDPWITGVLGRIIADDGCRQNPERYFLVRGETPDTPYSCVAK